MNKFSAPIIMFSKAFLNIRVNKNIFLSLFLLFITSITSFAQQAKNIGSVNEFKNQLSAAKNQRGAEPQIQTSDAAYPALLNRSYKVDDIEMMVGEVKGSLGSHFRFAIIDGKLEGNLLVPALKKAYHFYTDANGNVQVEVTDIHKLICIDYDKT